MIIKQLIFTLLTFSTIQSSLYAQSITPDFVEETIDQISIGYGLSIGDVDGDQRPDILLADKQQFVWYRNGDWKKFVMADNLTTHDNVSIAARDINGDGKVEVAVGAQWNPDETTDDQASGSVHYLARPDDPQQPWQAVQLHHEPTVHRMQWIKNARGGYELLVLPLHGRGNAMGEGEGVKLMSYRFPDNPQEAAAWDTLTLDQSMHMTHNLEVVDEKTDTAAFYVAGKEGVFRYYENNGWQKQEQAVLKQPAGEVRTGHLSADQKKPFLAVVEPMHGKRLVVYHGRNFSNRSILMDNMNQGHALACADVLGLGRDQVIVGWRNPNKEGKVGIKIFVPVDSEGDGWMHFYIDDNGIACEDLQVADLDGDGDLDIIASGRDSKNLKVYWNQLKQNETGSNE